MNRQKEIDTTIKYDFPVGLVTKYIDNNILVISPDTASWLLLKNNEQLEIFDLLKKYNIKRTIEEIKVLSYDINNLIYVLTEIEAKGFLEKKELKNNLDGLCLYLTNKCNLRCPHCYVYAGQELENELSTEEIFELLKSFRDLGGKKLILTGGEVTEHKDFEEIVTFAHNINLIITVLTNGTQWKKDIICSIADKINEIQISIDGYNEESNAFIRGKGNFQIALNTVQEFYDLGVKTTVAITPIVPINRKEYIEFARKLLNKYKNENFDVKFTYEIIPGRDKNTTNIDNAIYTPIINEIAEELLPDNKLQKFVINHKNNILFNNCGYGGITVSSNGQIYFCNRIFQLKSYGNIRNTSLKEIFRLSKWISELSSVDNISPCNQCDIRYICGGGCRISEVPEILEAEPFEQKMFKRKPCKESEKAMIYHKMIDANELFYY